MSDLGYNVQAATASQHPKPAVRRQLSLENGAAASNKSSSSASGGGIAFADSKVGDLKHVALEVFYTSRTFILSCPGEDNKNTGYCNDEVL